MPQSRNLDLDLMALGQTRTHRLQGQPGIGLQPCSQFGLKARDPRPAVAAHSLRTALTVQYQSIAHITDPLPTHLQPTADRSQTLTTAEGLQRPIS
jgi:hypothetical protein